MAEPNKKGMISNMQSLLSISGEEMLEVIRLDSDGVFRNYKLLVSKIRNNQGLSAYEIAVQNGFVGSAEEWLESLKGQSAYKLAVDLGFVGTEEEFLKSLKGDKGDRGDEGQSIYDIALQNGFVGTEQQFLATLIGDSAYEVAVKNGFQGTEAQWLLTLKGVKGDKGDKGDTGAVGKSAFEVWQAQPGNAGKPISAFFADIKGEEGESAYEVAKRNGFAGTEAQWLTSLVGDSAYKTWLKQPGNAGKTEADFIKSLEGLSAYEVAKKNGYVGTEAAWVLSLQGLSAYDVAKKNGFVGTEAAWLLSLEGSDGLSAYETYKKQPGNANKTEAEFIASLKGKDGTNGTNGKDGAKGESAYESYKKIPGNESKTEAEFVKSLEGKSAFQTWVALPGNEGKNESQFIASLKGADGKNGTNGEDGADGDSAYEIAQQHGFVGTETDWVASLKGEDGEVGQGINVIDTVSTEDFEEIKREGLSNVGDAYIVKDRIYIWNGVDWVESNPMRGPAGQGLNFLGEWKGPTLPLEPTYVPGDAFLWKNPQGITSLWTLVEEKNASGAVIDRRWVDIGVPGPAGESNYQIWLRQPGNAGKTEAEFIASLKGGKGDKGDKGDKGTDGTNGTNGIDGEDGLDGASAYEIAVSGGYVGTEAEWLKSLKGEQGIQGLPALAFEIMGRLATEAELPKPGKASEAYYVVTDLYIWLEAEQRYENFGSLNGQSAYELWLKQPGNAGKTEEEFLNSLNGEDGDSAYDTWLALPGNAGKSEAEFIASLKGKDGTNGTNGEDGTDGSNGESAYELWLKQPGNAGKTEAEFLAAMKGKDGVDGTDGKDGANLVVLGRQPNLAAIQALPNPKEQDAWTADDSGHLYIYSKAVWVDAGIFRGLDGKDGTNGTNGKDGASAFEAYKAIPGNENKTEQDFITSITGKDGEDGVDGVDGRNVQILGAKPNKAALPADAAQQDAWTTLDDGHLYMFIGAIWVDLGQFKGDKGEQGEQGEIGQTGPGLNIFDEVETIAEATAAIPRMKAGDAIFVYEDHKLYQLNEAGVFNPGIRVQGPDGEKGDKGEQGPVGPAINIVDTFATEAALKAKYPTGAGTGNACMVGNDLWLYAANPNGGVVEWYNAGPIRGPQGDRGPEGPIGRKGTTGDTGPRGSVWIRLIGNSAPTPNHGTEGDWAINDNFITYYKQEGAGWQNMGHLSGGGDVYSPDGALADKLVVRQGTNWVELPVGEVPNIVDGKLYARKKAAAGEGTEWVEIEFPIKDLEAQDDTKQYARVYKTGADKKPEWAEISFPEGIKDIASTNPAEQYVRTYDAAAKAPKWATVTIPAAGIPEAPEDAKLYGRKSKGWVEVVPGISAPVDATKKLKFVRMADDWSAFNSYDLVYKNSPVATAAVAFDCAAQQMVEIENASGSAKTVTFSNIPEVGRVTTAVLVVKGKGNAAVGLAAQAGVTLKVFWNGDAKPEFTDGYNVVTVLLYRTAAAEAIAICATGAQSPSLTPTP